MENKNNSEKLSGPAITFIFTDGAEASFETVEEGTGFLDDQQELLKPKEIPNNAL